MDFETPHDLGWKRCFEQQLSVSEMQDCIVARVGSHLGSQVLVLAANAEMTLPISLIESCGEVTVGDWLLLDTTTHRGVRRLERDSLIARKAAGEQAKSQPIAANIDTLFIVSSCNHDFNLSRLERYLALASEAQVTPIVVLTKSDLAEDAELLRQQATQLKSGLIVELVDARDSQQTSVLSDWCRINQTVAIVGSSGVGKSTLAMSLGADTLKTQGIREDDSKGRHTTTARSIHRLNSGGLLIDTPGMRELQLADCEEGVSEVFDEIIELAQFCRFRNCNHNGDPGCAVQESIERGDLSPRRLKNYLKLQSEQARNSQSLRERRQESRKLGKFYKSVQASKQRYQNRNE